MLTIFLIICFLFQSPVISVTYNIFPTTTNWISILGSLKAGDIAYIHAGTYTKTAKLTMSLLGNASAPILVSGAAGETQPIISHTGASQNIIDLVEGNYFTLQNITLTGGSLGLRLGPSATSKISNGIIRNLIVHDTAETAISANFAGHTYTNLTFRRNEVYNTGVGTGECFYLGSSDGTGVIRNSLIVDNYCHHTQQATSGSVGSAFQVKDGSYNNTIQDNVCYMLGGPCVLLYSDRGRGRNKVIGNVILSTNDNGIQAAAGATIINNLIFNTGNDGIAIIQNPSGVTIGNITLQHNTVVDAAGKCLRLTNFVSSQTFLVSNNALYCPSSTAVYAPGSTTTAYYRNGYLGGSPPAGLPSSAFFLLGSETADLTNRAAYNVYPTSTSTLLNKGDATKSVSYDFNYQPRGAANITVGAYQRSTATNPGWAVTTGFKPPTTFVP